ncbi:DUF1178 family protein [Roseospira visakhapatnamensis]|uniref:DUF1178 family protein n=1 Tax=Roseospira visakhapatnamensis TaxID=390880 RepID=A0A7W6WBD0_9PROT|nr:DUF1178 family protein [Roseospira visakhapatnamensis]MBB4267889.1 hypothetical protein [Roseospira visakhapatnamensis]
MILYTLCCDNGHEFEAWFRDSGAYDRQAGAGVIACPMCGSARVGKAIMAPSIRRHHGARREPAGAGGDRPSDTPRPTATQGGGGGPAVDPSPEAGPGAVPVGAGSGTPPDGPVLTTDPAPSRDAAAARLVEALETLRAKVEATCDDVGDGFAEEARRIHYGEAEARGIYGDTTPTEAEALRDEGIAFGTIPWRRRRMDG